ncbi:MAG: response regulator transcription factor [candidate division Zixibacteria bacterium]|jgi:DNA-binding NarL/FixJ family response regulator|nr:response regulator transcription factor [candidate division Zixibacteria bacterium]NIR65418.1 response regulator transcription factor [candidate division Zixibacteria bacterium]NIS15239.1 response regulator transcription factor [candidate division Zixibacteria bacterium]NIS45777.1 response regulator transcription factor [candidate division Zixibacteria bacterium]NIT51769.1 response regulator transcription factor [candidate division Zixibacteria bacterium]
MKKYKIILADDHQMFRNGIINLLGEHEDFEVVGEASNGREALGMVDELSPDIIIVDIGMPILNGLETVRQISAHHENVRAIMLSMYINDEYVKQALLAGVYGYILKESAFEELVWALKAVVKGEHFLSPAVCSIVVKEYLKKYPGKAQKVALDNLTAREREVIQLVAEGKSTREISKILYISPKTVEAHRSNISNKLKLKSYEEIKEYAIKKGYIISAK